MNGFAFFKIGIFFPFDQVEAIELLILDARQKISKL